MDLFLGSTPILYDDRINSIGSMHSGGAQVALTDGSVQFVSQNISTIVLRAYGTRAGGEIVTKDW